MNRVSDEWIDQVEVDLTPSCPERRINIRSHKTGRSADDKVSRYLPRSVYEEMVKKYGEELTNRLIDEDMLFRIDWNLYKKNCNGGAEFELIQKSQ
jgi:hypothetical protein